MQYVVVSSRGVNLLDKRAQQADGGTTIISILLYPMGVLQHRWSTYGLGAAQRFAVNL